MCTTCGCGETEVTIGGADAHQAHAHQHVHADGTIHSHDHAEVAEHAHEPTHAPGAGAKRMVQIEQDILARNNAYAGQNRRSLAERGIFALNLVSSPGSGKTMLLCKTIAMLSGQAVAVIEGDQQTSQDAERIRATGAPAVQINTGRGCHLDAHMVGHAMQALGLAEDSLLMIENVGNLVCPAAFDLGEAHKVVILSVTEGEDKPIKYPDMFRAASLMLLNKIDLLPHLEFDVDAAIAFARRVNPQIRIIRVSAASGAGMGEWLDFLRGGLAGARAARQSTVVSLKRRIAELEAQLQRPLP
jgi:hydrogenase nickel incorporation protein HypB